MKAVRLLAVTTAILLAVVALAAASSETAYASGGRAATESGDSGVAIEAHPTTALFDVSLRPGDLEVAPMTVRNRGTKPVTLTMTPVLKTWSGHDGLVDVLHLSILRADSCTSGAMQSAPSAAMDGVHRVGHSALAPGETAAVCVKVEYPATRAAAPTATATVDFVLSAFETPSDATDPPAVGELIPDVTGSLSAVGREWGLRGLASTGAALTAVAIAGAGLLAAGFFALRRRHLSRSAERTP